jgi:hypothetical protein
MSYMITDEPAPGTFLPLLDDFLSALWRTLRDSQLCHFHVQPVQDLQPGDKYLRLQFSRWVLHKTVDTLQFLFRVLCTDEAVFTRSGVHSPHGLHVWAMENPHATRLSSFQHIFSVVVLAGFADDYVILPYVIQDCLGGAQYADFIILKKRDHFYWRTCLYVCARACGFNTEVPLPFVPLVCNSRDNFTDRRIGRGGPIAWPPHLPI